MYLPKEFNVSEEARIWDLVKAYPFATVLSGEESQVRVSHLPIVLREEGAKKKLIGHFARANEHWKSFKGGKQATICFLGPDGYISHTWYASPQSVPTWNYAAVHVTGPVRILETEEETLALLRDMMAVFEGPKPGTEAFHADMDYVRKLMRHIVGFEMEVEKVEAKFKLGQNRPREDTKRVIDHLKERNSKADAALANLMERALEG